MKQMSLNRTATVPDPSVLNAAAYRHPLVVREYNRTPQLQIAEKAILTRFDQDIRGKRVLDIGVGCGRTTPYLGSLAASYVGIDISPEMVNVGRKKYPSLQFDVCDVRDLSRYGDGMFDMILFSFNGLDVIVENESRLRALAEIRRTLVEGGLFVFSSHNRGCRPQPPWNLRAKNLDLVRRPLNAVKELVMLPVAISNHARMRRREYAEAEYALVNDDCHSYSFLHYYVFPHHQALQLKRAGFTSIEAVGLDGVRLESLDGTQTPQDPWIYYACRKPAATTKADADQDVP